MKCTNNIQHIKGEHIKGSIGEAKYVGTLQALLLVGIFHLDKLLFNIVSEIERQNAKMDKNSEHMYQYSA